MSSEEPKKEIQTLDLAVWNAFGVLSNNFNDNKDNATKKVVNIYSDPSKQVKPTQLVDPVDTPVPDRMLPDAKPIDATINRAEILDTEEIPELVPVFLGVRKWLAERRITKSQAEINKLADDHAVIRYVGESIIKGKGYLRHEVEDPENPNKKINNIDRPTTPSQLKATRKLERIAEKRRREQVEASHLAASYPVIYKNKEDAVPPSPEPQHIIKVLPAEEIVEVEEKEEVPPLRQSRKELANVRKNSKTFDHLTHKTHELDDKFKVITHGPARRSEILRDRIVKNMVRTQAIDDAREYRREQLSQASSKVRAAARRGASVVKRAPIALKDRHQRKKQDRAARQTRNRRGVV